MGCRICAVSFTDATGVRHAVEVPASTLYEGAALAIAEFRGCAFTEAVVGPSTRLAVTVASPATTHELAVSKLEAWLNCGGKSPNRKRCSSDPAPFVTRAVAEQKETVAGKSKLNGTLTELNSISRRGSAGREPVRIPFRSYPSPSWEK